MIRIKQIFSNLMSIIRINSTFSSTNIYNIPSLIESIHNYLPDVLTSFNQPFNYYNNTISSIPIFAFKKCSNLIQINCSNCSTIGGRAFDECSNLIQINCSKCSNIGNGAFNGCSNLSEIIIKEHATIGTQAFQDCINLVNIPTQIGVLTTSIGSQAFANCSSLSSVHIKTTSIQPETFKNCVNLTSATCNISGAIGSSAFENCTSLSIILINENKSGNYIYTKAFASCHNLISLYLFGSIFWLNDDTAFSSTPIGGYSAIAGQIGSIFVYRNYLDTYSRILSWRTFTARMCAIEDYPPPDDLLRLLNDN